MSVMKPLRTVGCRSLFGRRTSEWVKVWKKLRCLYNMQPTLLQNVLLGRSVVSRTFPRYDVTAVKHPLNPIRHDCSYYHTEPKTTCWVSDTRHSDVNRVAGTEKNDINYVRMDVRNIQQHIAIGWVGSPVTIAACSHVKRILDTVVLAMTEQSHRQHQKNVQRNNLVSVDENSTKI